MFRFELVQFRPMTMQCCRTVMHWMGPRRAQSVIVREVSIVDDFVFAGLAVVLKSGNTEKF